MDAYIFQADIYCAECGKAMRAKLAPDEDSDQYPQGPYADDGGEADIPQHCGACGVFLENPLTSDGYAYVQEMAEDPDSCSDIVRNWLDYYGLTD